MAKFDYIIVGQGIAGSCLAFELLRRGLKVALIDDCWRGAACLVAAGVVNPITGKRLVKSWRSELAHPFAKSFYEALEKSLGAKFYHPRKILQLCKSDEECELWKARSAEPEYSQYIEKHLPSGSFKGLSDSKGSYIIGHSAWVEAPVLMSAFKNFFLRERILVDCAFDFSKLKTAGGSLAYENFECDKIVFCEGWRAKDNPYFSWLPWRPAKGEILEFESATDFPDNVVHKGNWIMKCGENSFRMGSTWDRENLDDIPTEQAGEELFRALKNIMPDCSDARVTKHSAGVRPCTATTRPHLGVHPADSRLFCFNGFGSKGYALSPYFARHFADWLTVGAPLDCDADLKRHIKKFFVRQ